MFQTGRMPVRGDPQGGDRPLHGIHVGGHNNLQGSESRLLILVLRSESAHSCDQTVRRPGARQRPLIAAATCGTRHPARWAHRLRHAVGDRARTGPDPLRRKDSRWSRPSCGGGCRRIRRAPSPRRCRRAPRFRDRRPRPRPGRRAPDSLPGAGDRVSEAAGRRAPDPPAGLPEVEYTEADRVLRGGRERFDARGNNVGATRDRAGRRGLAGRR
jgi:hypothetical protein